MLGRGLLLVFILLSLDMAAVAGATLLQRPASSRCPLGSILYKSSCYQFSHNTATYAEALSYCKYFNSNLAAINSRAEYDFISGYLKRKGEGANYYIDGTDLHIEGIWTWENPLRKMSYLNWNPGQPDNEGGTEHCLELREPHSYRMNDITCERKLRFVCEFNL